MEALARATAAIEASISALRAAANWRSRSAFTRCIEAVARAFWRLANFCARSAWQRGVRERGDWQCVRLIASCHLRSVATRSIEPAASCVLIGGEAAIALGVGDGKHAGGEGVLLDLELARARGADGGDGCGDLGVAGLLEGARAGDGGDRSVDLVVALTRELGLLDDAAHAVGGGEADVVLAGGGGEHGGGR